MLSCLAMKQQLAKYIPFLALFYLLYLFIDNHCKSIKYSQNPKATVNQSLASNVNVPFPPANHKSDFEYDPDYQVFRVDGKPIIWAFWDKRELPAIIALSLATVFCHNRHDFHLEIVRENELSNWVDYIHPAFQYLRSAHKADYFRARILDEYGGIYLDADSIGFASFRWLFNKLFWYNLVNISWPPDDDKIAVGVIGPSRARSKFTRKWVTNLHVLLDAKLGALERYAADKRNNSYPIAWAEMLRQIVVPIVNDLLSQDDFGYFSLSGHRTFGQLTNGHISPIIEMAKMKVPFRFEQTELLMYHNSEIAMKVHAIKTKELIRSDMLIAGLVRRSMKQCRSATKPQLQELITIETKTDMEEEHLAWIEQFVEQFLNRH